MKLKSLLIAALIGAGSYCSSTNANAQSYVYTSTLAPLAVGNTVCVTRYPDGRVYAKGYSDSTFSTVVEYTSLGGLQYEWWYEGHYLYLRAAFSPFTPARFYICPPSGPGVVLTTTVNTNAQVGTLGLETIGVFYTYLDVNDGLIGFYNNGKYGQVQFRAARF